MKREEGLKLFGTASWRGFLAACMISISLPALGYTLPASNGAAIDDPNLDVARKVSKGLARVASQAKKGIVFVAISKTVQNNRYGLVDPYEFFFGPGYRGGGRRQQQQLPKQEGVGSGFIVDLEKGYILTNNHVIDGADEIHLKLANGKTYDGIVVGRDKNTDVAVVRVKDEKFSRTDLTQLTLGDSDNVTVGEMVVALGSPFRLEASLSFGVVSAIGRQNLGITELGSFIQTDAAINPGNSGGPLLDLDGKVIGVNSAIYSTSGAYAGIGFAVPANLARQVAEQLITDGRVSRGYLGVGLQPIDQELAKSLALPDDADGALVARVEDGSPAAKAGIEPGDVITEVNNKKIESVPQLVSTIGLLKPGAKVDLTVFRSGKKKVFSISIVGWSDDNVASGGKSGKGGKGGELDAGSFGVRLQELNAKLREEHQVESKVGVMVVDVAPNSPADRAGIEPGDVVLMVNGKKVINVGDFKRLIAGQNRLLLRMERAGEYFFKTIF